MAWCGQAEKLGVAEKEILSHFQHQVVKENKLQDGETIAEPFIKYRTIYEKPGKERKMSRKGLNATRMGELLLKSDDTPDNVKETIASKMRSAFAKDFVANLRAKRAAAHEAEAQETSELMEKRKSSRIDGTAAGRVQDRQATLDSFVNKEPALSPEHANIINYRMSIFFYMCRLPFMLVDSKYLRDFLKAIRVTFEKSMLTQVHSFCLLDAACAVSQYLIVPHFLLCRLGVIWQVSCWTKYMRRQLRSQMRSSSISPGA